MPDVFYRAARQCLEPTRRGWTTPGHLLVVRERAATPKRQEVLPEDPTAPSREQRDRGTAKLASSREGSRGQEICLACSWGSRVQSSGLKEYVKHKLFRKQTRVSRSQEQSPPSGWSTREKVDCKSHHMLQTFGTKASGILLNFQKKKKKTFSDTCFFFPPALLSLASHVPSNLA